MKGRIVTSAAVAGFLVAAGVAVSAVPMPISESNSGSTNAKWHSSGTFTGSERDIQSAKRAAMTLIPASMVYGSADINAAHAHAAQTGSARARWASDLGSIWAAEQVKEKVDELDQAVADPAIFMGHNFLSHARLVVSTWDNVSVSAREASVDVTGHLEYFGNNEMRQDRAGQFQIVIQRATSTDDWLLVSRVQILQDGF